MNAPSPSSTPSPAPAPAPGPASPESDWSKVLAWAETAGTENLKSRHATLDGLRKEATTTLTVILAGLGGALTYAAKVFEPQQTGPIPFAATILCVYLTCLAAGLVLRCMLVREIPAVYQSPMNLAQPGFPIDEIREAELTNIEARINDMLAINAGIARALRAIRILAVFSPVIFAIAAAIYQPKPTPASVPTIKLECRSLAQQSAADPQLACSPAR